MSRQPDGGVFAPASKPSGRRWRWFFIVAGMAVAVSIAVSVAATSGYQSSLPPGCTACGLGAVGLVPLYLLSAVAVATLVVGFLIWLFRSVRAGSPGR
jgi:hypothetical protein